MVVMVVIIHHGWQPMMAAGVSKLPVFNHKAKQVLLVCISISHMI